MSETIVVKKWDKIDAADIQAAVEVGVNMGVAKRGVKEVDGPYIKGDGSAVFIVYTEDLCK